MIEYAHAIVQTKASSDGRRRITGIATTPAFDRQGDSVDPMGATFTNPIKLLLHHDQRMPVGLATLHPPTPDGIRFDAEIVDEQTPGLLRDRSDDAWQSARAGLLGASIGYRILSGGARLVKAGMRRLSQIEICELSLVAIPANMSATVEAVKSLDSRYLAAPGRNQPTGDPVRIPELLRKGATPMTNQEQINQYENSRAAKVARMAAIMAASDDATLDDAGREEYDGLSVEVKNIDDHLVRFRELERLTASTATRVEPQPTGIAVRPSTTVVSVKSVAPAGLTYARAVKSLLMAKGDSYRAMQYAKAYNDGNVDLLIKAAVAPGTTTDPAWAGALVQVSNLTNEFIELSRAATILGKVTLRNVPFNVSVPIQTAGGTYKWVGQAKAKPVTKLQFGSASLGMAKAAGIIVLTEELVMSSKPSAEMIVRDSMVRDIAAFLDQQFIDPAVAAVPDVSPASITNGAPTVASTGDPQKDLAIIVNYFTTNQVPLSSITVIMSEANAYGMGYGRNALGVPLFPSVGVAGGSANGLKIVASNTAGDMVIGVAGDQVLLADDGGVKIDVSREATIQMNDAPVNPADPATAVWTSFFQDNLVGLRAERFINWKKAVPTAVTYITGADYLTPAAGLAAGASTPGARASK